MPNGGKVNQGCISNCVTYKLEVRMSVLCSMKEFTVGSHVKVIGALKYGQSGPYLWVTSKENIRIESNDKKSISLVLKGKDMLKRKIDVKSENTLVI